MWLMWLYICFLGMLVLFIVGIGVCPIMVPTLLDLIQLALRNTVKNREMENPSENVITTSYKLKREDKVITIDWPNYFVDGVRVMSEVEVRLGGGGFSD